MQNHNIKILEEYLDKQDRKFVSPKKLSFLRAIENIIEDNNATVINYNSKARNS